MNIMPMVCNPDFRGNILDLALNQYRTINITGEIDDTTATLVNMQILHLSSLSKEDIHIYINSGGGSIAAGLAIYDSMVSVDCDIEIIVAGMAASMAAVILSGGTPGKRRALKRSLMMIHQPHISSLHGRESDVKILSNYISHQRKVLSEILASNCGKTEEQIEHDTEHDYYMTAEEAVAYGLIDSIVGE